MKNILQKTYLKVSLNTIEYRSGRGEEKNALVELDKGFAKL